MDSSFEKAERARAASQIAVWNQALSWFGPLREYARISTAIRPGLQASAAASETGQIERRLQFLGWEVESLVETYRAQGSSALETLNLIFFRNLEFSILDESGLRRLDGPQALLESVLARRQGPRSLIAILYAWLGEIVARNFAESCEFSRIELVHGTPTEVVRVIPRDDRGEVWLIDLSKAGARVEETLWSTWCANSSRGDGFTKLSWVQGLVRSLTELFNVIEKMPGLSLDLLSSQLYVLDQIISLQPSETSRWAERAMLNTRRGDRSGALDDLKRFFAFHDRDVAPPALVSLFDDLRGRDLNS